VVGVKVDVITGFTGDSSCTLAVGTSGDSNLFSNNTTVVIYTAATVGIGAQNDAFTTASTDVLLTATSGSDFTSVSAGKMIVTIYYMPTILDTGTI
jgi:hypothetical protein